MSRVGWEVQSGWHLSCHHSCLGSSCLFLALFSSLPACRHGSAFQIDPQHDYSRDPRVRRPPAAAATSPAAAAADKGIGKSTYQAELLLRNSSDIGGSCGASGGSASAPCSPAHRPAIAAVRPGYLTTAAASQLPVAERYAALSLSAGGSPKSPGSGAAVERCSSWQAIVGAGRGARPVSCCTREGA